MDAAGLICLVLAAVALAANQALKDAPVLTRRLQWLRPKGWWNYLPLSFLVAAGIAYGLGLVVPSLKIGSDTAIVIKGIPVERLKGHLSGRTTAEAKLLMQPYIGTYVDIAGPVSDIRTHENSSMVFMRETALGDLVSLSFTGQNANELVKLQIGDRVRASCTFQGDLDRSGLSLSDCVLVPEPRTLP